MIEEEKVEHMDSLQNESYDQNNQINFLMNNEHLLVKSQSQKALSSENTDNS